MDKNLIFDWFCFADNDLDTAEIIVNHRPQHYEIICYHCQQSAEKYLKAYLIYKGITEPPKTHNLDMLCGMCITFDDCFHELKKACVILTPYGVQPRYPNEMLIEESHMKKALVYAKQIKDFAPLQAVRSELEQAMSGET